MSIIKISIVMMNIQSVTINVNHEISIVMMNIQSVTINVSHEISIVMMNITVGHYKCEPSLLYLFRGSHL
jgi:hypothetical protein